MLQLAYIKNLCLQIKDIYAVIVITVTTTIIIVPCYLNHSKLATSYWRFSEDGLLDISQDK